MPTLVNCSGNYEFGTERSGLMLSLQSRVDVYCTPRKRARLSCPYVIESYIYDEEKKASIDILPNGCLYEIFRRLPGSRERSASACVSKRWVMLLSSIRNSEICRSKSNQQQSDAKGVNKVSNDVEIACVDEDLELDCDGCLTRCLEGTKATDLRLAAISVGTSSRGGLGKLSIRGSNAVCGVTNLGLSAVAHGCSSLRVLSLWDVPEIGNESFFEIARGCNSLEKLDLSQCPTISDEGVVAIAKNCPNLTSISFESCSSIGNESLQAIGKYCHKLQSVTLKDCPLVGDVGVASLLSMGSSVLKKVKLQALNITDFSLAVLGHYGKAITNLVLCRLQSVSQKGFWVMGNAQGLQTLASLTITSCTGTTDLSLEAIGKGSPNLKQMCLRKCCFVSDNGLVAFSKVMRCIENLQLEECNRITQKGILNTLSNCNSKLKSLTLVKCMGIKDLPSESQFLSPSESLRSLSIRSCPGFGSTSLAMIGKLCPMLHHLDLSGLSGITDSALLSLLENSMAGFVKVHLNDCLNLTDEAVSALARLHGETLEVLNLDGCKKVTDSGLAALADNCSSLKDLDVSRCSITDSGIAALSCAVFNLQILSLSGCSKVSNRSMTSLIKLGKTLVGLNIQHCDSIRSSTTERLMETLWRCDILS